MTRVEELRNRIAELRESGAEPEDIAQVVQELNMELAKVVKPSISDKGGGARVVRKKKVKEDKSND